MEVVNNVFINELTSVRRLCRVCLTESIKMIPLDEEVEQILGPNVSTVLQLLFQVTLMQIPCDKRYPSYMCPMCMSLLKMSYKFKLQFEKSQKLLSEYFGEYPLEEQTLTSLVEVIQEDQPEVAPVELISKQGKYDLKDVFVIETEEQEKPNYSGFLKNLGREVSATFANERMKMSKQEFSANENNCVTIVNIKHCSQDDKNTQFKNTLEDDCNKSPSGDLRELYYAIDDMDENDKKMNRRMTRCSICQKVFANKKYLKFHVERMHLHKKQTFVCEVCGAYLKSRSSHYHHMLKHYGKRQECSHCHKTYFNSSTLQQHITAVHKNSRLHLCTICGKSFNYANALDYHMRIHTDERKYKCSYCNKTFRMQCGLNRHLRIHTGIRPYKCKFCEKAFRSKGELNCHEMIHTGYRPYHCKYCGKGFTKTYNLKMHLLGHSGKHACDICNKTFIEFEFLKIHTRTYHAMKDEVDSEKES